MCICIHKYIRIACIRTHTGIYIYIYNVCSCTLTPKGHVEHEWNVKRGGDLGAGVTNRVIYIYTHIHIFTYIYIHTYMYIYVYVYVDI